jgi:methionine-rich copper-binding protein CopC
MQSTTNKIVVWTLTATCSACIGFGVSQATQAKTINDTVKDVQTLRITINDEVQARRDADLLITKSLDRITSSIDKQTEQNTQLIMLIKVQNQMLKGDAK